MFRAWVGGGLLLVSVLFLAVGSGCAQDKEKAEEKKPIPVSVQLREAHDGHKSFKWDLNKDEDVNLLVKEIRAGNVERFEREQDINLIEIRRELAIWTIVVFLLLFLILRKVAWGPMLEGLQKREQNIVGAIEDARQAREEAQKLREQLQKELDRAHEKVRDILDEARRDAQRMTEEMLTKARAEMQADRDRLRREIQTAHDQALQDLWNQTAHLATIVSSKAIQRQLSEEDHRRLVDEALAEMQKTRNGQHA